jgi:hypothetical protein
MAQVSGIEVNISGNTSGLDSALGRAESSLSRFAKGAAASLAGALSVGLFVQAGRAALDYADNIGKMAQKIGMTTEELSRLNYAAKLSDLSLQELQGGLQQLSKNMEAGSEGLAALGISATDSSGNLRSTSEVMLEVAEAFAGMEDGAGKTAIAMNIFGRSGANLIPMLNAGRNGLASMGDEAKRLGVVISDDAARAAETFNDNMTRLQTATQGVVQEIMTQALPAMIDLTEKLLELIRTGPPLGQYINNIASWFAELKPFIETTRREVEAITEALRYLGILDPKPLEIDIAGGGLPVGEIQGPPLPPKTKAPRLPGADGESDKMREPGIYREEDPFFIDRLEQIREQFKTEREVLAEEYALNQEVLDGALANKLLTEQEYYDLSRKLAEDHAAALASIQQASISQQLSDLGSGLGSMAAAFQNGGKKMLKVSKAFAAAQAIVATIQAAVDAMKNPLLIDPASKFAAYAAVFAKGMSAVAAIKGVSDSGGGGGGAGGGRAAARGGGMSGGGASAPSPTTTFQFTMMNDPMGFGEKFARQFIDQLNSTQRNGGTIRGVIA